MTELRPSPVAIRSRELPLLLLAFVIAGLLGGASCSSPGNSNRSAGADEASPVQDGPALRVTYRDMRTGVAMDFASSSHPIAGSGATKLLDDESMEGFLDALDEAGFDGVQQDGRAPSNSRYLTRTLEVQRNGRIDHFAVGEGSPIAQLQQMNDLFNAVFVTFNNVSGWRTVENPSGANFFDEQNAHLYERRR